jgi:hypothetical protein
MKLFIFLTNLYNLYMSVLDTFSRIYMTVVYVAVQLFQNESHYMIVVVITYVGLSNHYKGRMLYS